MTDADLESEIRLSRYLDGEMDAGEATAFEAELEQDPALAARLAQWRGHQAAIMGDFGSLRDAPAPAAPADNVVALPTMSTRSPRRWAIPTAIAASLAAVLAFTLRPAAEQDPALAALEALPSGQSLQLASGDTVTAVLTFAAADGRWCREYAVSDGRLGIACREQGDWMVEHEMRGAVPAQGNGGAGYDLAAGSDGGDLDAAYEQLGGGEALGAQAESDLLQRGWTRNQD